MKRTLYLLRDEDVIEALRVINRTSTNGELHSALQELLVHAEVPGEDV